MPALLGSLDSQGQLASDEHLPHKIGKPKPRIWINLFVKGKKCDTAVHLEAGQDRAT
jgi:hypothetical protein